jgi:hypothetical protein
VYLQVLGGEKDLGRHDQQAQGDGTYGAHIHEWVGPGASAAAHGGVCADSLAGI